MTISDSYEPWVKAEGEGQLRDTGRLLTVRVANGGAGYTTPPKVTFPGLEASFATNLNSKVTLLT